MTNKRGRLRAVRDYEFLTVVILCKMKRSDMHATLTFQITIRGKALRAVSSMHAVRDYEFLTVVILRKVKRGNMHATLTF